MIHYFPTENINKGSTFFILIVNNCDPPSSIRWLSVDENDGQIVQDFILTSNIPSKNVIIFLVLFKCQFSTFFFQAYSYIFPKH